MEIYLLGPFGCRVFIKNAPWTGHPLRRGILRQIRNSTIILNAVTSTNIASGHMKCKTNKQLLGRFLKD